MEALSKSHPDHLSFYFLFPTYMHAILRFHSVLPFSFPRIPSFFLSLFYTGYHPYVNCLWCAWRDRRTRTFFLSSPSLLPSLLPSLAPAPLSSLVPPPISNWNRVGRRWKTVGISN